MPGFSDSFQNYLLPNDNVTKNAMTSGMIVLDTNVLLSAYRFAPTARGELLSVLDGVADRIWIPNRVAEEFHRNRLQVISDYDSAYMPVLDALCEMQENLNGDLASKVAQLANRAALTDAEKGGLLGPLTASIMAAISTVDNLRKAHGITDLRTNDEILARFQQLFDNRTGSAFNESDLKAAITEAERRTANRIPPGYLDSKKSEPYGDYFIWRQALLEVRSRSAANLVFVTGDVKEDWYLIIKGKTIGARPELAGELQHEANAQLIMMNTTSFLFHAREHLNAAVSPETIRQAEALPTSSNNLQRKSAQKQRSKKELDRLERRVDERRKFIYLLQGALTERMRNEPVDADEIRVLQNQLNHAVDSERILTRRLTRMRIDFQDTEPIIENVGADDEVEALFAEIEAGDLRISKLQDDIEACLKRGYAENSPEVADLRRQLDFTEHRRLSLIRQLDEVQE